MGSRGSMFRFLCNDWGTFSGVREAQSLVFWIKVGLPGWSRRGGRRSLGREPGWSRPPRRPSYSSKLGTQGARIAFDGPV